MATISHSGYGSDQNSKSKAVAALRPSSSSPTAAAAAVSGYRTALQRSILAAEQLKGIRMKAVPEAEPQPPPQEAEGEQVARDFGGTCFARPSLVVYPSTAEEIARVMRFVSSIKVGGRAPKVAARGNGHCVAGQALAPDGVVIEMQALAGGVAIGRHLAAPDRGGFYADVGGGRLWVEILDATLASSLSPRSFTDYLYLTVGGTLQNAGVGGQCFRHGPLISNVARLDVITATGDIKSCSPTVNPDLFYGSLGGLGQFGIISKARILLQPAPQKVRWIRLVYANFADFTHDQEHLIITGAAGNGYGVDYLEGFVVANNDDPVNGWPAVLFSDHRLDDAAAHSSVRRLIPANAGPVLYCLEMAKYYNHGDVVAMDERIGGLLRTLRFVAGLGFQVDATYREFLDRVHTGEVKLQKAGLWHGSPHPWLCLFVPATQIQAFDAVVFKSKLCKTGVGGPILVYPMLRSKWPRDPRCSAVIPEEEIFYMVALLRFVSLSAVSSSSSNSGRQLAMNAAEKMMAENEEIVRVARAAGIKLKRYLPHFRGSAGPSAAGAAAAPAWEEHFGGAKWAEFCRLKRRWDPQGLLAPNLRIPFPDMVANS